MKANCNLSELVLSGCEALKYKALDTLSQCSNFKSLDISRCKHMDDRVLESLKRSSSSIRSLNALGCTRLTENGVRGMILKTTRLTTLKLTCDNNKSNITSQFGPELCTLQPFAGPGKAWFGLDTLPDSMDRILAEEDRRYKHKMAIRLQSFLRMCVARGGVRKRRERIRKMKAAVLLQSRWRCHVVRVRT